MLPDGSKEGWAASDRADACRSRLLAYLQEPGATGGVEWVEVAFGETWFLGQEDERPVVTSSGVAPPLAVALDAIESGNDPDGAHRARVERALDTRCVVTGRELLEEEE